MKNLLAILAVVAVSASAALAGDGNIPQSTLSSMGLSGLKTISDAQGLKVRGMGAIASVNGASFALMVDLANPPSFATADSDYTATGFGASQAGAAGDSSSAASLFLFGTPTAGVAAQTASSAVAFGQ
jgi:hypothetical protein